MIGLPRLQLRVVNVVVVAAASVLHLFAQSPAKGAAPADQSMFGSFEMILGIVAVVVIGGAAIVFLRKKETGAKDDIARQEKSKDSNGLKPGEMRMTFKETKKKPARIPKFKLEAPPIANTARPDPKLPVYEFVRLERSSTYKHLANSQDDALMCAIEQTQEESEEDGEMRSLALKILAAFKNENAVNAVAQMALYDLSSKIRSTAVSILADIDHESVFETIVTACADPTREVRAAAARALFRLNFDRAQAWTRIIESDDLGRMRQAARAAMEGDLVERSFERLTHKDKKVAYEAFVVTALLIRAGETDPIYKALADQKDEAVKLALLHVLQTFKNDNTFQSLSDLMIKYELTPNVAAKVNEVRSYTQLMGV